MEGGSLPSENYKHSVLSFSVFSFVCDIIFMLLLLYYYFILIIYFKYYVALL